MPLPRARLNLPIRPVCSQRDITDVMTGCDTLALSDQMIPCYRADGRSVGAAIDCLKPHLARSTFDSCRGDAIFKPGPKLHLI
jgi:hypothetical protein